MEPRCMKCLNEVSIDIFNELTPDWKEKEDGEEDDNE